MINLAIGFDKYSIFIFLIIIFQCFHSISMNSFSKEFLIQLIPYLLVIDPFLFSEKFFKFIKRYFSHLIFFNLVCALSVLWTTDLKFTLASNLELFLTSITTILIVYYSTKKKFALNQIAKVSLLAIYTIIFIGIFTIDIDNRTFLGLGPSLFSSIINYGSVCSLYLLTTTRKNYYLISFCILLLICLLLGSVRGVLAILIGLSAYLKIFNSKSEFIFYLKVIFSFILIGFFYLFIIMVVDINPRFWDFIPPEITFIRQLVANSNYLKSALTDIFLNNQFDISNHMYAGERFSSLIIGIKETLFKSPIIGFGQGNSKEIFANYGKSYSHNGIVDVFMGTGFIGLYFYLRFILKSIFLSVNNLSDDLLSWKRFSSLVFGIHLMVGLPFESIPLSMILALIISV